MPKVYYEKSEVNKFYRTFYWSILGPTGFSVPENVVEYLPLSSLTNNGYRDSDWRVKVAKRQDASSSYSSLKYRVVQQRRSWGLMEYWTIDPYGRWIIYTHRYRELGFHIYSSLLFSKISDSSLRDIALKRFKSKLSGRLGNAELLVPAVELRELRGMISETARLTEETLKRIRSQAPSFRGQALVKFLQKAWLTYSFGVKPLVSDTISAAQAVSNYLDRPTKLHRISASAESDWVTGVQGRRVGHHGFNILTSGSCEHRLKYVFTAGIDFDVVCGNNYGMAEHLGFSDFWDQLPSVGWELLPFSWIADYFSTMGDYLSDTFQLPPGSTKYLTETVHYSGKFTESSRIEATQAGAAQVLVDKSEPGFIVGTYTNRKVLSQLPHRSLRFKTVDEIGVNAVARLLNLSSLLDLDLRKRLKPKYS